MMTKYRGTNGQKDIWTFSRQYRKDTPHLLTDGDSFEFQGEIKGVFYKMRQFFHMCYHIKPYLCIVKLCIYAILLNPQHKIKIQ